MPEFKEIPQINPERPEAVSGDAKPKVGADREPVPEKIAPFRPADSRLDLARQAEKIVPPATPEPNHELSPAMKSLLDRLEHANPEQAIDILNEVLRSGTLPPEEQNDLLSQALDRAA